jgi:hypothetical protein
MNKVIRNYPASKLPEDLREGVDPDARVTVTVEHELAPQRPLTLEEIFALRQPPFRSADDIVADIRQLRDEAAD